MNPICPIHNKEMSYTQKYGWSCKSPIEKNGDTVTKWCQYKPPVGTQQATPVAVAPTTQVVPAPVYSAPAPTITQAAQDAMAPNAPVVSDDNAMWRAKDRLGAAQTALNKAVDTYVAMVQINNLPEETPMKTVEQLRKEYFIWLLKKANFPGEVIDES